MLSSVEEEDIARVNVLIDLYLRPVLNLLIIFQV